MRQMHLHTEAFEHRCFSTQKHSPRDALTYTRLYTQKLLDTDGLSENHRSLDTEKPLQRESFTHRSFYTQAFPQIPQKLLHRESFWAQELLHTDVFTHRSLYTRRLLRPEAFTQRSLYTHTDAFPQKKTIPQSSFYTFQKIAILRKFLTFGHHIVQKGCIRRWTIILRERVAPDLVKSQFYTSFISRETVVPDVPKWI